MLPVNQRRVATDPPHVHKVKAVDGLISDEELGTRYASEVIVVR